MGGGGEGSAQPQNLLLKYGNRHGLIAGATGTGKTVTLQVLAEGFSAAGVPVFLSDIKGDLSGLAAAGSAGAAGLAVFPRRAAPGRVDQRPADDRDRDPGDGERQKQGDDPGHRGAEQALTPALGVEGRGAHRVTSAIRALYQFMKAETASPMTR